jgi:hypothetical protein
MRLACGSAVLVGVLADLKLKLLLAALGRGPLPLETGFEPRCGRGIVSPEFANFVKCRWRRACKPAAKPAIPGAILLHYAFLWYERDPHTARASWGKPELPLSSKLQEIRDMRKRGEGRPSPCPCSLVLCSKQHQDGSHKQHQDLDYCSASVTGLLL